jgi:hypothetical protein
MTPHPGNAGTRAPLCAVLPRAPKLALALSLGLPRSVRPAALLPPHTEAGARVGRSTHPPLRGRAGLQPKSRPPGHYPGGRCCPLRCRLILQVARLGSGSCAGCARTPSISAVPVHLAYFSRVCIICEASRGRCCGFIRPCRSPARFVGPIRHPPCSSRRPRPPAAHSRTSALTHLFAGDASSGAPIPRFAPIPPGN